MKPMSTAQTTVLRSTASGGGQWSKAVLTWYDPALGGINSAGGVANPRSKTASGEPYDANRDTCAAPPQYAFGTELTFQYLGAEVVCRVNDRGGAIRGNHFDLSRHAAETLGIINAGRVNAFFQVGNIPGASKAANSSGDTSGDTPHLSVLQVLTDLLTGNLSDLAVQMALASVGIVKDVALGIGDYIVIPWWHWNQRAVDYYLTTELFSKDQNRWETMPWTAAFWGLGYWLFFTDPDSKNLAPAPVRNSRIARHVRALQAVPARRELIKPKDVGAKTPKKPKPVVSIAPVVQTGTMEVTRNVPVKVRGSHVRNGTANPTAPRAAEVPIRQEAPEPGNENPESSKPHASNRARSNSLPNSGRNT